LAKHTHITRERTRRHWQLAPTQTDHTHCQAHAHIDNASQSMG